MGQRQVNSSDSLHPRTAHFLGGSDLTQPEVLEGKPTNFPITSLSWRGSLQTVQEPVSCKNTIDLPACRSVGEDFESLVPPLERPSNNTYLTIIRL